MSLLRNIRDGLRSLFRKEQVCQELDGFLEMAVEEKMKHGMSRSDALRGTAGAGQPRSGQGSRGLGWLGVLWLRPCGRICTSA